MAEKDTNTSTKDYQTDVPFAQSAFYVKGASHLDWGMQDRLSRIFNPRTGQSCDAGIAAGPASCTAAFNCVASTNAFPYTPSNFTEPQVPTTDGGVDFTVSCNTTIDT